MDIQQELKEYLEEFIARKMLSNRKFAQNIDMDPSQFHRSLKGDSDITLNLVNKIRVKYPDFEPPHLKDIVVDSDVHKLSIVTEYGQLITQKDTLISHMDKTLSMQETIIKNYEQIFSRLKIQIPVKH